MQIEIARPAHADELQRLNAAFNGGSEPAAFLAANLARLGQAEQAWLCFVDGRAVGFVCLRLAPQLLYQGPYAEITELYVAPAHRRHGVARALLHHAEAAAKAAGAQCLKVLTNSDNAQALALYRSLGFEDYDLALLKAL